MKSSIPYIITGGGTISAVVNGSTHTVPKDHLGYHRALEALRNNDSKGFVSAMDVSQEFAHRSEGKIELRDKQVFFSGEEVNSVVSQRITELAVKGLDFMPMVRFLENCLRNAEPRAVDELYLFLEANRLPLTEDGHFLAYRRVKRDYRSLHANPDGTYNSNRIGEEVTMPRAEVDANRYQTCSTGLHFASISYMPHYGWDGNGDRIMIVKIDPADVVSIPADYNNQKGRGCRYLVVGEHGLGAQEDSLLDSPVYKADKNGLTPTGGKYKVVRGPDGRFVSYKQN